MDKQRAVKYYAAPVGYFKAKNVKAAFFVAALSKDTPQKRQWIKRESDEGHTVGIHKSSVEAIPEIIGNLRAMGLTNEPLTNDGQNVRHKPALRCVAK